MAAEGRSCSHCNRQFSITEKDTKLLSKFFVSFAGQTFEVPLPTECPACRYQKRLSHRNERRLYRRTCDSSGKSIISIYAPDSPFIVYAQDIWWSDAYDPLEYGRAFDFSRTFFDQFADLEQRVPKLCILNAQSENSIYTNYSAENKNCYLVVGTAQSEDCYYGYRISLSKDVIDSYDLYKCELCFDCSQSANLFGCRSCWNCQQSSDLVLCHSCVGCDRCFGCINLRNKRFHIFNEPHSEQEYYKKIKLLLENEAQAVQQFEEFRVTHPYKATRIINTENSDGDDLMNCKNATQCFTIKLCEDVMYCHHGEHNKDSYDSNHFDNCSLQLNSANLEQNYFVMCGNLAWYMKEAFYVSQCFHSQNVFGCTGLKKQSHCILNKQYSPSEYSQVVAKIIKHMHETGEWGHYFPIKNSAFAYNESVAQDIYPLEKSEAEKRGYRWREVEHTEENSSEASAHNCKKCGHSFRIVQPELNLYRKMNLPQPSLCFECRHQLRMSRVNRHELRAGKCDSCNKELQTSYSPDAPERIFCQDCFLAVTI